MADVTQSEPTRHLEVISGALALLSGFSAIGFQFYAPLVTAHVKGINGYYTVHQSNWVAFAGFNRYPLGLTAVGVCLLCLVAIGYGTYAHGVRHVALGRLLLWCGTALLGMEVILSLTAFSYWLGNLPSLFPMILVAPYLLPSLGLALLASGAATA